MKEPQRLVGAYLLGLEPVIVSTVPGKLLVRLGGVPEELAARLVGSGGSYVVKGSQLEGATFHFDEGDPSPGGRVGGVIDFVRSNDPITSSGRGLQLGPVDWEADEEKHYEELSDRILVSGDGLTPNGHCRGQSGVSWNGFPGGVSSSFTAPPCLTSTASYRGGLRLRSWTKGGTGNRAAVYGTPYGLWAMWFALVDRDNLTGSIRSGVMRWTDRASNSVDVYNFSVHHELVGTDIWRTGTLYLFRRDGFAPIAFHPGGPASNEWASESALTPVARLTLEPTDFPFRDRVGGHDDGELIAAEAAGEIVLARVNAARAVPGGLLVSLSWDDEVAGVWDEYLASRLRFNPDVHHTLTIQEEGSATIEVRGPGGFLQAYTASLQKSGVQVELEHTGES